MWYTNKWLWAGVGFVAGCGTGWGAKVVWDKHQAKKAAAPATVQAAVTATAQAQAPAPAPTISVPIPPPSQPVATGEGHPSAPHAVALVVAMRGLWN